jgi:hypothetical protein
MREAVTMETIHGDEDILAFDHEVAEALEKAREAVMRLSGEPSNYVRLPDGRHIAGFEIVEETLSDDSKAYEIRILASDDL